MSQKRCDGKIKPGMRGETYFSNSHTWLYYITLHKKCTNISASHKYD